MGRGLANDDAGYDKVLSHLLFAYVHAGTIEDAIKVCHGAHRPWRAATIRSSLLFSWPISAARRKEGAGEDGEDDHGLKKQKTSGVLISACCTWMMRFGRRSPINARNGRARRSHSSVEDSGSLLGEVQEGLCADDPFHVSQLHIILECRCVA
ncbi:hypothetical protein BJY52DRAFT_637727 [Lactarius psammicola]|nr:hypothetical protein BJY52DRAFT_637727 [Lactarius psammicola]